MQRKVKIEMDEELQLWLLRRLKLDWDEELNYQASNSEIDTEYLENLFKCYIAILGKPISTVDVIVNKEIAENMLKELEDLQNAI